jgi:hypothetical protein
MILSNRPIEIIPFDSNAHPFGLSALPIGRSFLYFPLFTARSSASTDSGENTRSHSTRFVPLQFSTVDASNSSSSSPYRCVHATYVDAATNNAARADVDHPRAPPFPPPADDPPLPRLASALRPPSTAYGFELVAYVPRAIALDAAAADDDDDDAMTCVSTADITAPIDVIAASRAPVARLDAARATNMTRVVSSVRLASGVRRASTRAREKVRAH